MKLSRRQNPNPMPATQLEDRESAPTPAHARVTIEDLLRLKRAERPDSEFWADFEKQLKQRQLAAAIHEERPWWRAIPAALPRFAITLSAGAVTATLAIGIIVWRNGAHQTAEPAASALATTAPASTEKAGAGIATTTNSLLPNASTTSAPAGAQIAQTQTRPTSAALATHATNTTNENDGQTLNSATPDTPNKPTAAEVAATQPVSEESIQTAHTAFAAAVAPASNFAFVTLAGARPATARNISSSTLMAMPVLAGDLLAITTSLDSTPAEKNYHTPTDSTNAAPPNAEASVAKTDDIASNPRNERLLSYMDATATPAQTPDDNPRVIRVRDRATSRLNNKVLTDSVSRFGATGGSLSIKF